MTILIPHDAACLSRGTGAGGERTERRGIEGERRGVGVLRICVCLYRDFELDQPIILPSFSVVVVVVVIVFVVVVVVVATAVS